MRAFVFTGSDVHELSSLDELAARVEGLPFWWLDVEDPPEGRTALAAAVQDDGAAAWLNRFGQLPRYEWTVAGLKVVAPVYAGGHTVEVHLLLADDRMVSCHADAREVFDAIRQRAGEHNHPSTGMAALVLLLEDLLDTFRPVLAELRKEMYELSDDILVHPSRDQMARLSSIRRRVHELRTALVAYADAAEDFVDRLTLLPEVSTSDRLVMQGHAAHTAAIATLVEGLHDAGAHAMEVYVSMVTTRQGQVINWLTFVSIVFLPLTFITGFFGMNFDWMVNNVSGPAHFWLLGVGLQIVVVALVFIAGRRLFPVLRGEVAGSPAPGLAADPEPTASRPATDAG